MMISLSPGLAQSCFELLGIVSRNSLTVPQILSSFAYIGSMSASKVLETTQGLAWIRSDDTGNLVITPEGARLMSVSSYEAMLRQTLIDYIDVQSPPWVQNACFGRSHVLAFASSEIAQVFIEADLAHGTGDEVVAFWDTLAAHAHGLKSSRMTAIGRIGERLTIAHEEERTGKRPKWVAIDNNEDGYDVLSIVTSSDPRQLSIEVKTTTMGIYGSFHLTRNEWERSLEASAHLFHLWSIVTASPPGLAVIAPRELEPHIPVNSGDGCWEVVEVPFSTFADRFQVQSI